MALDVVLPVELTPEPPEPLNAPAVSFAVHEESSADSCSHAEILPDVTAPMYRVNRARWNLLMSTLLVLARLLLSDCGEMPLRTARAWESLSRAAGMENTP